MRRTCGNIEQENGRQHEKIHHLHPISGRRLDRSTESEAKGATMNGTWRERSRGIIVDRFYSIRKIQPQLSDADILKMVSLNYYPFGERRGYPYAAWLLAMGDIKRKLGVIVESGAKRKLPLFEKK